jgi:hypothetical protein
MKIKINKLKSNFFILLLYLWFCLKINVINKNDYLNKNKQINGKRIGIIAYTNSNNIGNQLLKYAMDMLLKSFGFQPTLISIKVKWKKSKKSVNADFLKKYLNVKEIRNYSTDLNENEFDILVVNSDQVWAYNFKYILDVGFLSFAKNWNIRKFVYAASLGYEHWTNSTDVINSAKILINQFSGVSVREENSIEIINQYLGIRPLLVLDPTLLIDKDYYLEIIKNFKMNMDINKNYLCSYILDKSELKTNYIKKVSNRLKLHIINIKVGVKDFIEKFLFSINRCKSVITDSFHGTVFAIIFKKPFITFINIKRGNMRFLSLNKTLLLDNRFIYPKKEINLDIDMLTEVPKINITNFNILKERSILFLKKNLGMIK